MTSLAPHWASSIVPEANNAAYQEILGALLMRGYSAEVIAAWDRGREFQLAIGVHLALLNGGAYKGVDLHTLDALDRRKELSRVVVFTGGVLQRPTDTTGTTRTCGFGGMSTQGDTWVWPGNDQPDNGGSATRW